MRTRIAAVIGVVVFAVLAGTGVGHAYWSETAQVTGSARAASLSTNCTAPTKLVNGGFEQPNISPDAYRAIYSPFIPGWSVVNDNAIEIWRTQLGSTPPEGAQIVELNANGFGTAYQVVDTVPGQVLRWSLKHRGREGNDTMSVAINADGAALSQQAQFTTGTAAWSTQSGAYTVPSGQTRTRISLVAVATANNAASLGNLVDDVSFGTGPCLTASATITNITTGGATYRVGDVVEYATTVTNSGGNHADSSVFTAAVPTGLVFVPGSITVNGVAKSDGAGNDEAELAGTTITARLGAAATASAGGSISPANSATVRFRATIQSAAAGASLSFVGSASYVDALAPTWPMTAVSPTVATAVAAASDTSVAVQSLPVLNASSASQPRSWVFRVTNLGPSAATGVSVTLTVPNTLTARTASVAGGGTCTAVVGTTSTCTIGALASGASRDITVTGTMPAVPSGAYAVSAAASSTTFDPAAANNTAAGSATYDGTVPTTPTGLAATRASSTQINLAWTASTDAGSGIAGYRIYRNGVLVTTTSGAGTTFSDTGLASHLPYWYWVVAVDGAGNASAASTGEGAVTYAEATSYRVQFVGSTMCAVAANNANNSALRTQSCTTATSALRQWSFTANAGDSVFVRFQSGTARAWYVPNDTNGTDIVMSTTGNNAHARAQWTLGASWNGTAAAVELRRSTATTLCVEVTGGVTTANAAFQQATCTGGAAQRFALVQP